MVWDVYCIGIFNVLVVFISLENLSECVCFNIMVLIDFGGVFYF